METPLAWRGFCHIWEQEGVRLLKSAEELNRAVETYADMVRRICFVHLKNRDDTEDVFQNVFLKYMLYEGSFADVEHEKAWFVRVTINACTEVLEVVLRLPEKYRNVIYLFYYEGYSAVEIAGILGRKENTVYTWLSRAKDILREKLGGEWA